MNIALLTTETTHHAHFARALAGAFGLALIVSETRAPAAPFPTAHPFEEQRDAYELETWFRGERIRLSDIAPTIETSSANDARAIRDMANARLDAILVFGTGRISQTVIDLAPERIVNLHGGDPEHYRGLDTHLWAVYHRDFAQLITTLHHVNERYDDGAIVDRAPVPVRPGMPLHELRARNTDVCVELALSALRQLERGGSFTSRPQRQSGRWYSFMPAVLKEICVRQFDAHTRGMA